VKLDVARRRQIYEGKALPRSIVEFYYKNEELDDPLVCEEHITAFGWASQDEMNDIADMAIRVNDFLCGMFAAIGIRLIDFKLEFGRVYDGDYSRVILADEISPDGCRLWDLKTNKKLDKDRFRQDLGEVEEAYQEVARRLGLLQPDDDFAVLDLDSHRKKRGK
jgi:phosphoribosylaminoimidazole-succinocarboxamide synthase